MQNKINTEGSMPQTFNEVWIAIVGKQKFELTGEQVALLKSADTAGKRGMIWFNGFAINLFNIECLYLDHKTPKNAIQGGNMQGNLISPEQRAKNRERIKELREKFKGGLPPKKEYYQVMAEVDKFEKEYKDEN